MTETDRVLASLFSGWMETLTLLLVLFVALTLWGWAHNRGFRPADRGPNTPWLLLLIAFAALLVVRAFGDHLADAIVVAVGVMLAGLVSGRVRERALWLPGVLLAALMGMGFMLSALVLTVAGFLLLLLSPRA